jgi:NADPH:quinone reductase-like Zn-dependent oxidoreductase
MNKNTMKAMICTKYGPADVLQLKEVDKPTPKDNELLIRIDGAAVNSTDPTFRLGKPLIGRLFTGLLKPKFPIPGDVLAGEIEAVGKDVTRFKIGDQIYGTLAPNLGTHAEYTCMPEDGALTLKPTNMTYGEAAAIVDGALTALTFLRDTGKIQRGQNVLIYGASGSVGTAAIQLAKSYGATVTGVCSTSNLEMVQSLGADDVIDYTKEDFTKNGEIYDIIFDTVAKSSFSKCKSALKHGGLYLTTFPSLGMMLQVLWTSMVGSKKAKFAAAGMRSSSKKVEDLLYLKELIEAGKLTPAIDRSYTLSEIAEAHKYVEKGHKKGNVVISIGHIGHKK